MGAAPSRRWLENGHCACFEAASRRGRRSHRGPPTERRSHPLTPVRLLGLWEPRPRGDGLENGYCACFEAASRRGRRSHRGASHTLTPVRLLGLWEPRPRGDGFKMTTVLVSRLHRAEGGAPTERRSHTLTPVRLLGLWEPRPRGDGFENGHCACFEAASRRGRRSYRAALPPAHASASGWAVGAAPSRRCGDRYGRNSPLLAPSHRGRSPQAACWASSKMPWNLPRSAT